VGYGLNAPLAKHNDYEGRNVEGQNRRVSRGHAAQGNGRNTYRRALGGRSRYATEQEGAVASIGVAGGGFRRVGVANPEGKGRDKGRHKARDKDRDKDRDKGRDKAGTRTGTRAGSRTRRPSGGGQFGGGQADGSDFTTVQRLDATTPPAATGQDDFFEFLFSSSDVKYAELKDKAAKGEPLPSFRLKKRADNLQHRCEVSGRANNTPTTSSA